MFKTRMFGKEDTDMLAILSNSIESADRLSDSLQNYWNAQGVYTNVSLFECESEFLQAMAIHTYKSVILDCAGSPIELIQQIRIVNPACKIAVLVDDHLFAAECEMALACRRLGVEMVLSYTDIEQPLAMLSKGLCIV